MIPASKEPITADQKVRLRRLAEDAYELDAYSSDITQAEAEKRIAMLTAKLRLLDEPPYVL